MSFAQKEIKQIKEYANAVRELSLGVEIKSKTVLLKDDNHVVYGTTQAPPDVNGLEEQKMAYMREMLFLLVRDFRPISRLYERKIPGRVQTLKDIQQQIKTEMKGRDWVWVDRDENLITIPHCPGDSIDLFVEELLSDVESEKKSDKLKQLPKKYQPWKNPGDAHFILKNSRIIFHYKTDDKDLKLSHSSRAYKLLYLFASKNPLSQSDIKELCKAKTRASDYAKATNETLNKKIAAFGFSDIPRDIAFVKFGIDSKYYGLHPKIKYFEADESF